MIHCLSNVCCWSKTRLRKVNSTVVDFTPLKYGYKLYKILKVHAKNADDLEKVEKASNTKITHYEL